MKKEQKEKGIIAAVSGGADSMVMLSVLQNAGETVTVLNVEHGIRGESSLNDSLFVEEYCKNNNIPFILEKVDAVAFAKERRISLELAARELRQEIFQRLIHEGYKAVALAHHKNDRAETVLMRLFRGSSVKGLSGITEREGFIRPLLRWTKEEILDYAIKHSIPYVEDETNKDSTFCRNFIRNEVLPLIQTRYPNIISTLEREADYFEELEKFLCRRALPFDKNDCKISLPLSVFDLPDALSKKSIAEAVAACGAEKDIETVHLNAILSLKDSQTHKKLCLPFGIIAEKGYSSLLFYKEKTKKNSLDNESQEVAFSLKSEYTIADYTYSFSKVQVVQKFTFDKDKIPPNAILRKRKSGDIFKRINGKRKSLSDYLTDKKVPRDKRDELLVLACESKVYLLLGAETEVSDEIKVDEKTKLIFKINIRKGVTNAESDFKGSGNKRRD